MITVFAVEWGSESPAEVDSLWTTFAAAEARAAELNAGKHAPGSALSWRAQPWVARDAPDGEQP